MTRDPNAGPKTRLKAWVHTTPRFRCPCCGANLSVQEGVSWVQAKLYGKPPFDPKKIISEAEAARNAPFLDDNVPDTAEGDSDG